MSFNLIASYFEWSLDSEQCSWKLSRSLCEMVGFITPTPVLYATSPIQGNAQKIIPGLPTYQRLWSFHSIQMRLMYRGCIPFPKRVSPPASLSIGYPHMYVGTVKSSTNAPTNQTLEISMSVSAGETCSQRPSSQGGNTYASIPHKATVPRTS